MKALVGRIVVLLALGAVDYTLHRPWRLFALLVIALYVLEWTAFRHRREALYIIRQRRHRLGNQLQLVTGWLQLGAKEKAEEALAGLMAQEASQSLWFRGKPSHWSYLFLRWDARGEERGVMLHWAGLDTMVPTYRMAWILERRLRDAMRIAETSIKVGFSGERFRILVAGAETPPGKSWVVTMDGAVTEWRAGRRTTRPGTPTHL